MKATGIVRRIDDLGRVVVPKEIRRTLRIREGDPLEIFTDRDGSIILKKYSPLGEFSSIAQQFCDAVSETLHETVCICDQDTFIAASGKEKALFLGKSIHPDLNVFITGRKCETGKLILLAETAKEYNDTTAATIICQGDAVGSIVLPHESKDDGLSVIRAGAVFLGKQLEN